VRDEDQDKELFNELSHDGYVGRVLHSIEHGKEKGVVAFFCPGCRCCHLVWTDPERGRPRWGFNGDFDKPTFTPSILVNPQHKMGEPVRGNYHRCHSFVEGGNIRFLNDCTHELAGKTVELEPF